MLSNLHTHTNFCDGKNTVEEIILYAISRGFDSIGFSGHGYTEFDLRYCMKDTEGYMSEVNRLKGKYKDKIEVYLGVEEDALYPVKRENFDYIIGSSHYFCIDGKYYPIDSNYDYFKKCIEVFSGDVIKLAEVYYEHFCAYIKKRRPDIVGHFDLITKFDEIDVMRFLNNEEYSDISEKYMGIAAENDVIFELNTGAISRGFRKFPYPNENLLHILKKKNGKLILSSDSHNIDTLDYYFGESRKILKNIGFQYVYVLHGGKFIKDFL